MGISFNGHAGAIDWIQSRFKKSKPATLYFDEIRTPTYTDCLNELCEVVLASDLTGLYHAGGPRRLSLYNIAQIINRVGGYDPKLLLGCPRIEAGPIPPRRRRLPQLHQTRRRARLQPLRPLAARRRFRAHPSRVALRPHRLPRLEKSARRSAVPQPGKTSDLSDCLASMLRAKLAKQLAAAVRSRRPAALRCTVASRPIVISAGVVELRQTAVVPK